MSSWTKEDAADAREEARSALWTMRSDDGMVSEENAFVAGARYGIRRASERARREIREAQAGVIKELRTPHNAQLGDTITAQVDYLMRLADLLEEATR